MTTGLGTTLGFEGALSGRWLQVGVSELAQGGQDLNVDGDTDDTVLFVVDVRTGRSLNTKIPVWPHASSVGGMLGWRPMEETFWGSDLNGDGDLNDWVPTRVRVRP